MLKELEGKIAELQCLAIKIQQLTEAYQTLEGTMILARSLPDQIGICSNGNETEPIDLVELEEKMEEAKNQQRVMREIIERLRSDVTREMKREQESLLLRIIQELETLWLYGRYWACLARMDATITETCKSSPVINKSNLDIGGISLDQMCHQILKDFEQRSPGLFEKSGCINSEKRSYIHEENI